MLQFFEASLFLDLNIGGAEGAADGVNALYAGLKIRRKNDQLGVSLLGRLFETA
jgi:hypothetical protein